MPRMLRPRRGRSDGDRGERAGPSSTRKLGTAAMALRTASGSRGDSCGATHASGRRSRCARTRPHSPALTCALARRGCPRPRRSERPDLRLGLRSSLGPGMKNRTAPGWTPSVVPFPCTSAPFTTENPKHDVGTPDRNRISVNPSVKTRKADKTGKTAPRDGVSWGDAKRAELRPVRLASPQAGRASSEAETSSTSDPMVSGPKSKRSPADSKSSGSGREPPRARARL